MLLKRPFRLVGGSTYVAGHQVENALRFNADDLPRLDRTVGVPTNRKRWIAAFGLKLGDLGRKRYILNGFTNSNNYAVLALEADDTLRLTEYSGGAAVTSVSTSMVFRDPSAHYLVVVSYDSTQPTDAGRVQMWVNGVEASLTHPNPVNLDFDSFLFNDTYTLQFGRRAGSTDPSTYLEGYLSHVVLIDGYSIQNGDYAIEDFGEFDANGIWRPVALNDLPNYGAQGGYYDFANTTKLGEDARLHNLIGKSENHEVSGDPWWPTELTVAGNVEDGPYGRPADKLTPTAASGEHYIAGFVGATSSMNTMFTAICKAAGYNWINLRSGAAGWGHAYFDLADGVVGGSSGVAPEIEALGNGWYRCSIAFSSNGGNQHQLVVAPADWTTTFTGDGTSGVYIAASQLSYWSLWRGYKHTTGSSVGAGNHLTETGLTTDDQVEDTPTRNYAVLNWADKDPNMDLYDGNLIAVRPSGTFWKSVRSTIPFPAPGKWYVEYKAIGPTMGRVLCGVMTGTFNLGTTSPYTAVSQWSVKPHGDGSATDKYDQGTETEIVSGEGWSADDTIMLAFDADAGDLWFGKNGTWYPPSSGGAAGDPANGTDPTLVISSSKYPVFPYVSTYASDGVGQMNFGQLGFAYTPPSGFEALHTGNLPDNAIPSGDEAFDALLYTGDGSASQEVNGLEFQPSLVWLKNRSAANNHKLLDAVRGAGLSIQPNDNSAESAFGSGGSTFDADGFTLDAYNNSGENYVAWCLKEGVTPGFDIIAYTGDGAASRSIAHGLGVTPAMVIVKSLDGGNSWRVWHPRIGNPTPNSLLLDTSNGEVATTNRIDGADASNVNLAGGGAGVNNNGDRHVMYVFAEVPGFSRFGSYAGNGGADGPFIWTGFRPRWFMLKRIDSTGGWFIHDAAREIYNPLFARLEADTDIVETANSATSGGTPMDFLASGVKLRMTTATLNANGGSYIFAAFAEHPFGGTNVSPATAR